MKHQLKWLGAACVALTALGCEPDPEGPGDPCDLDDNNCPGDLVCETTVIDGDEEDLCHLRPGAACDRQGTGRSVREAGGA